MEERNYDYLFKTHGATKQVLSSATGQGRDINLSSIADILIENTGRFCEQYLSDLFITWDGVRQLIDKPVSEDTSNIIVFAIRKQGVDSNTFLNSKLEDNVKHPGWCSTYYRRIYTLHMIRKADKSIECELKDVTDDVGYRFEKQIENKLFAC